MSLSHAIAYGIIQGLTEFLPVSSSAHLTLLPFFTGWEDPGLAFDVALHWGTLLAVLVYFRKDVLNLILNDRTLGYKIALATVPGAVIGFLLEEHAETVFRSPALLAVTLSVMGIFLLIADKKGSHSVVLGELSWKKALLIGLSQGLAIVPGVSRSGVTIATGLLLGLEREAAVKFSFYLAIPITMGAGLLKSPYLISNIHDSSILVAIVSSALAGFAAIQILITYVRTKSFTPFVVYRLALAGCIVVWLLSR